MAKRKDNRDRAKALCEQAGFNPEELVERPGLPSAPRWLAYIQQANDEDKMGDKKAFVMPQPSEYENSHLEIVGDHEANTISQMEACMKVGNVVAGTLCADGHKGYAQPVGGVIAYENQISISGVGFDIACGNMAIKLDTTYGDIKDRLVQIRDDISTIISFGVGRTNGEKVDSELFDDSEAWKASDMGSYKTKAVGQLGTVGSGNHYVDILIEKGNSDNLDDMDDCNIWIGVHFGSRGFGHSTATRWLKAAGGIDGMDVPPTVVDETSEIGERYIAGMTLAGRYAYAGREWVCERVRKIIGGNVLTTVHNHHNYCIPSDGIVSSPSGPKLMKDVKIGDVIYTVDSDNNMVETNVTDHWKSGKKCIYSISTSNRKLRCSGEHPIRVYENNEYTWKRASDIKLSDSIVCSEGYFDTDNILYNSNVYRFIGAYIGDGWIRSDTKKGYTIGLAIGNSKEVHTHRYLKLLNDITDGIEKTTRTGPVPKWYIKDIGNYGINTTNKDFYNFVLALGIGEKSTKRRIPSFVFSASYEEKIAVLSGYVDADGSVSSNKKNLGRTTLCANNKGLITDLRELSISCKLSVTNITKYCGKNKYGEFTSYRFNLDANSSLKLDLWHEDKKSKLVHKNIKKKKYINDNLFLQEVKNIIIEEEEDVYDLTVDNESHSFICDGVVVHNCWKETHNGKNLWVVRKGATPAFPGQLGFVGGSMGDDAVIIEGVDSQKSKDQLYSTVHGAGRLFGRRQALKTFKRVDMEKWLNDRGVLLSGADLDESPMAYRRLNDVIGHHSGTVKVTHHLRPVIVAMAGKDTFDPWKD